MNTLGGAPGLAAFLYISYKNPLRSFIPNDYVTTTYSTSYPKIKQASLDKLYFPEPPTPTNIALPIGKSMILAILDTCSIAC